MHSLKQASAQPRLCASPTHAKDIPAMSYGRKDCRLSVVLSEVLLHQMCKCRPLCEHRVEHKHAQAEATRSMLKSLLGVLKISGDDPKRLHGSMCEDQRLPRACGALRALPKSEWRPHWCWPTRTHPVQSASAAPAGHRKVLKRCGPLQTPPMPSNSRGDPVT